MTGGGTGILYIWTRKVLVEKATVTVVLLMDDGRHRGSLVEKLFAGRFEDGSESILEAREVVWKNGRENGQDRRGGLPRLLREGGCDKVHGNSRMCRHNPWAERRRVLVGLSDIAEASPTGPGSARALAHISHRNGSRFHPG